MKHLIKDLVAFFKDDILQIAATKQTAEPEVASKEISHNVLFDQFATEFSTAIETTPKSKVDIYFS